jgi:hypothetical protein
VILDDTNADDTVLRQWSIRKSLLGTWSLRWFFEPLRYLAIPADSVHSFLFCFELFYLLSTSIMILSKSLPYFSHPGLWINVIWILTSHEWNQKQNLGAGTFHQHDILSTWHFVNMTFCQLNISSMWHFVILTTRYFVKMTFYQTFRPSDISSFWHFVNMTFCQNDISSDILSLWHLPNLTSPKVSTSLGSVPSTKGNLLYFVGWQNVKLTRCDVDETTWRQVFAFLENEIFIGTIFH